jgi:hypothetical protein
MGASSGVRFGGQCDSSFADDGGRQLEGEIHDFVVVEGFAVGGEFELARDQTCVFKLLKMEVEQRAADADVTCKPAYVIPAAGVEGGEDAEAMGISERGQDGKEAVSVYDS